MQPLIMLHGALGAPVQLQPLALRLAGEFAVYTPCFTGHGGAPFTGPAFLIDVFAADVIRFLDEHNLASVPVFGYSMGGYVGMYLAKHFPDRIDRVVTLATKFYWDEATSAKEVQMLDPEKVEQKVPAFADTLRLRHQPNDWKEVMTRTADMMIALGRNNILEPEDYKTLDKPSLLLLGDRDKMVTLEETHAVYKSLPDGQFGLLPGTPHPIEQVDISLLAFMIARFLQASLK